MPFVPALNIAEVFMEHSVNDKTGIGWVLHYGTTGVTWDLVGLEDLAVTLTNWWESFIQPLVSSATNLQRVRLRDITTQNGLIYDSTFGLPLSGTATGQPASNNVSLSVKKNTGFAGKSKRGRIYQLGLTENHVVGNFIDSTYRTAILAAWEEAKSLAGGAETFDMFVVSKYSGNAPRSTALLTAVSGFSLADTRVDTRRDRL